MLPLFPSPSRPARRHLRSLAAPLSLTALLLTGALLPAAELLPTPTPAATATATATPAAPQRRPDADAVAQLFAAMERLQLTAGFHAQIETQGVLQDNKLNLHWATTGDLTWRPDFVYEFHLAPTGSAYRKVQGLATATQRYLVFPDDRRYATRAMSHMNLTLSDLFAGTEGEHYLFATLHRLALLTAPPAADAPVPPAAAADPVAAVWGDCRIAVSTRAADQALICAVTLQPDLGDKLTILLEPTRVTFTADRSERMQLRLQDNPPAAAAPAGRCTYTETWTLSPLPADFAPAWELPKDPDGKEFAEITLNAFGRDHLADRLVGQPAPPLVVDSFPPVYDVNFGPGLPAAWGPLPGIVAPRVMPHFDPLPTAGPKPIDWSEEPQKAQKIVDHPVTLSDLLKRYPDREVAVVFIATWTAASQAALKDLAGWQSQDAPVLVICNENTQTLVDDLGRRVLPVSVCRDPQGRNGIRFGVDDYPMVYRIKPDRTVASVQRGWADSDVKNLKTALRLP